MAIPGSNESEGGFNWKKRMFCITERLCGRPDANRGNV